MLTDTLLVVNVLNSEKNDDEQNVLLDFLLTTEQKHLAQFGVERDEG